MSTVRVRSFAQSPTSAQALSEIGQQLVGLSRENLRDVSQRLGDILTPVLGGLRLPRLPVPRPADACCAIPVQECPRWCVCEIRWEAAADEELRCAVRVRNTSSRTRTFEFSAVELEGPSGSLGTMTVTPEQLTLPPQRSGLVRATLTVPSSAAEGSYEGEILVRGAYEQCVRVLVTVVTKGRCRCDEHGGLCEVEQGDPPVRIRAHHWYDHFQCVEACARNHEQDQEMSHT